jgi:conjugal transfer pilus assembly protein TraB
MSDFLKIIINKIREIIRIKHIDNNEHFENISDEIIIGGSNKNSIVEIKKKQYRNLAVVMICLILFLSVIYFIVSDSAKEKVIAQKVEQEDFASPIKHIDAGSVLIERVESRLAQTEKTTENLQRTVEILNLEKERQSKESISEQEKANGLLNRIAELEKTIEQMRIAPVSSSSSNAFGNESNIQTPAIMTQGIRDDVIILENTGSNILSFAEKNPQDYVPSGTFVKAITLGGADASAAVNAQSNPQPMLFRIIEDGTLPNNQKSHLKGCLATAAVVGDISSERGFIRLETLSCVEPVTKRIIDISVEGTVFGPEGKGGVRGAPMWREGALLQRAFAAGALSGLASSISQKYTQTAISPLGAVNTIANNDLKNILANGATTGLSNAMERLADYNIRRAEQYHPVLQLSAGTEVDLVFLKGFYLTDKSENIKNDSNPKVMSAVGNTEANTNNLNNVSHLTITPEQAEKLKMFQN